MDQVRGDERGTRKRQEERGDEATRKDVGEAQKGAKAALGVGWRVEDASKKRQNLRG